MALPNFPGPGTYITAAGSTHSANALQLNEVRDVEHFNRFLQIFEQVLRQPRTVRGRTARTQQIAVARGHLIPLRVALTAADAILTQYEAAIATEEAGDPNVPA